MPLKSDLLNRKVGKLSYNYHLKIYTFIVVLYFEINWLLEENVSGQRQFKT